MDLAAVIFWLFALNVVSTAAFFSTFSLIGMHWVKRRTPAWLKGPGLYVHYFLDGLEYSLTKTALGICMARSILVFKLMQKNLATANLAAAIEKTAASSTSALEAVKAGVPVNGSASNEDTCKAPGSARTRPRILPPKCPVSC